MTKKSRIGSRFGLFAAVTALALGIAAPAAIAHDEVRLSGQRTPAGIKFAVPVPAIPMPSFGLELNGRTVDSSALPSAVGGGTMIVRVSALNTLPTAYLSRHCDEGQAGTELYLGRVGPGAVVNVSYGPSAAWNGPVQRLTSQRIGVRRTSVSSSICAGL